MKFDAVNGIWSTNSSALKDPSVVSKVAIGFVVDDAIARIRLLLALLRVLREEEEETTFLITRRSDDVEDIFEVLRKNLISKSKKTLSCGLLLSCCLRNIKEGQCI
jgi:hypothetical protein